MIGNGTVMQKKIESIYFLFLNELLYYSSPKKYSHGFENLTPL